MLEKALGLFPDAIVPDMEDSVPPEQKDNARNTTATFLPRLHATAVPVIPRVNAADTGLIEEDLAAVVGPNIFGVSVGKIRSAEDVRQISDIIDGLEKRAGLQVGGTRLVLWLESAMAIVNAYEICAASPRIAAVAFGSEDFAEDMEIVQADGQQEVAYPRSVIAVAAAAAGVLSLDTPYFHFRDLDGLKADALAARRHGFRGKFAIHPGQIAVINRVFTPSSAEVEHAQRVVDAFTEAQRLGSGATSLDGKLIDVPVVKRAQRTLALAQAISNQGVSRG